MTAKGDSPEPPTGWSRGVAEHSNRLTSVAGAEITVFGDMVRVDTEDAVPLAAITWIVDAVGPAKPAAEGGLQSLLPAESEGWITMDAEPGSSLVDFHGSGRVLQMQVDAPSAVPSDAIPGLAEVMGPCPDCDEETRHACWTCFGTGSPGGGS